MKIVLVHNDYGAYSGEEKVVRQQHDLLVSHDHEVITFRRSSSEIPGMRFGQIKAFFAGIHNPAIRFQFRELLKREMPDLVHIHNLFPFISPAILPECRRAGVPVVMTVHNFRLICPVGLFYVRGRICEKCLNGCEAWCAIQNCAGKRMKSLGYALRNWIARFLQSYHRNVNLFLTLTQFQREKLIAAGFSSDRIRVLPNSLESFEFVYERNEGDYVGFIGRLSPEKGIDVLHRAATRLPDVPLLLAGERATSLDISFEELPHVMVSGHLSGATLDRFWAGARFIVLPSIWYEGFPMVIIESLARGVPVICSRIGGLPEIIEDGQTGLLVTPGDDQELADKIQYLWERPELARQMGVHGRRKFEQQYTLQQYYDGLMQAYFSIVKRNDSCPDVVGNHKRIAEDPVLLRKRAGDSLWK